MKAPASQVSWSPGHAAEVRRADQSPTLPEELATWRDWELYDPIAREPRRPPLFPTAAPLHSVRPVTGILFRTCRG